MLGGRSEGLNDRIIGAVLWGRSEGLNDRGSVGGRDDNLFHPFVVLFFIPLFLIDFACLPRSALILVTLYQRETANSAKNNACARLSRSTSQMIKW